MYRMWWFTLYRIVINLIEIYCFLVWFELQLLAEVFTELLDSIIVDVASESHRIARLGLDRNLDEEEEELRLSAEARARASDPSHSGESNGKYIVDIFGQTHPPIANEIFDCMNCGRSIMAGRFAPHLEKCMGKVIIDQIPFPFIYYMNYNLIRSKINISLVFNLSDTG